MANLVKLNSNIYQATKTSWEHSLKTNSGAYPKEVMALKLNSINPDLKGIISLTKSYALIDKGSNTALAIIQISKTKNRSLKVTDIFINPKDCNLTVESSRFSHIMAEIIIGALKLSEQEIPATCVKILGSKDDAYLFLKVLGDILKKSKSLDNFNVTPVNYGIWLELHKK
jgi:hypothetical protein